MFGLHGTMSKNGDCDHAGRDTCKADEPPDATSLLNVAESDERADHKLEVSCKGKLSQAVAHALLGVSSSQAIEDSEKEPGEGQDTSCACEDQHVVREAESVAEVVHLSAVIGAIVFN